MKRWIGAAIVTTAVAITLAAGAPIATAAPAKPAMQTADAERATDFSARRYHRRYQHHGIRTYDRPQPRYYARPYYYRPYPYSVPAPFTFGFGFAPGWW
ncbi:MAG: hypothetical protein Q8L13_07100 [Bradyrhizobium sp.]|nr:hypothetical protein [Bradyrhizobium sp.]MDP1866094.1 hypothetical protein [Bradyrhizobium sp.]MDP3076223.1 hypothetical protein [Bradyrhizobium sp.]